MEEKKIPSRGFQNIEHFFLSTRGERDRDSTTADAITEKNVAKGHSDSLAAPGPTTPNDLEKYRTEYRKANECIGSTVAILEVLMRSCQGAVHQTEGTSDKSAWFQGAASLIQEAITTLSEVMNPVGNNKS